MGGFFEVIWHIILFVAGLAALVACIFVGLTSLFLLARLAGGAIIFCLASWILGFGVSWTTFFIGCGISFLYLLFTGKLRGTLADSLRDVAKFSSSSSRGCSRSERSSSDDESSSSGYQYRCRYYRGDYICRHPNVSSYDNGCAPCGNYSSASCHFFGELLH